MPGSDVGAIGYDTDKPMKSTASPASVILRRCSIWALAATCVSSVRAQEALRTTLTEEEFRLSRRAAQGIPEYYNLRLGTSKWRFSSSLGFEYNDNVTLREQDAEDDAILRPSAGVRMFMPITDANSLDLSLDAGYSAYISNTRLNQFFLKPGSGLSFDMSVGNLQISLHERVSITERTYEDPTLSGRGDIQRLQNTIGPALRWDMNRISASLHYDHSDYISLSSEQDTRNGSAELMFATVGVHHDSGIFWGVEAGNGFISYDQPSRMEIVQDAIQWNIGGFLRAPITEHLSFQCDAGYTSYEPVDPGKVTDNRSLYFQASFTSRINQWIETTLSAGRSVDFAFDGIPYELLYLRLDPKYRVLKGFEMGTPIWWQRGELITDQHSEFTQYGIGLDLKREITEKLSGIIGYEHIEKLASTQGDYSVNRVRLTFQYDF